MAKMSLVEEVVKVFPNGEKVGVEAKIDDFNIPVKEISSLGIIVNELVTNAMKHAFAGKKKGVIAIAASKNGNRVTIKISDNGVGLPKHVNIETSTGFGMLLIGTLTKQMKGTIRIERKKGTMYILEFVLQESGQ